MAAHRLFIAAVIAASLGAAGLADAAALAEGQSDDGQSRRIRLHNQTGVLLQTAQAAGVGSGAFGADLLDGKPLAAGASAPVTIDDGAGGCLYDLRATLADGRVLLRESINVCRIANYYLTR